MLKSINPPLAFLLCLIALLPLTSCSNDDVTSDTIFIDEDESQMNAFDRWKYQNYTLPYNIKLMYKMEDIESDYKYTLAPADYNKSVKLAHIVKYAWLEAYDEVAGINFTRKYVPKILHFIGSPAYNQNGTMVLGTAEGGLKVTLYMVNSLKIDESYLNTYYFHTMHHEFAHILHQTKNYDPAYDLISEGDYIGGDWYLHNDGEALQLGFVSAYSRSEAREDIAEMTATYICKSQEAWDALIAGAGEEGAAIINRKLAIVKKYMQDSWGIDMDQLRNCVQSRMRHIVNGEIDLDSL
ncbi:MAG: putative zinc-binding metallopeptidase [Prevotella sp.]|nr:putative zinc-binding metallopeptidase [Prevotella sp.]MBP3827780.1 putative zinc-binding metallopeptidase [Prevotella sp.]